MLNSPCLRLGSIWLFMMILLLSMPVPTLSAAYDQTDVTPEKLGEIEKWIQKQLSKAEFPGMSVTIVSGNQTVYQKGFGLADLTAGTPVTGSTIFEIGSNSKAFTGLAVLKLEKEGKLKLNDPANQYVPWLQFTYHAEPAVVTLEQLLHHTGGIPFETIGRLPEGYGEQALEQTVRILQNQPLNREPGKTFEYATINYDVLGLVIEKVSGQSYADYMEEHIFRPLGLNHTYVLQKPNSRKEVATGYKVGYTDPRRYSPPYYSGNAPAGYVMSSAEDMALWLKIQLGTRRTGSFDYSLIENSHDSNRSVQPDNNGSYYAAGWDVHQGGKGEISHAGNNPTFSSFVGIRPGGSPVGVAVLANMNSDYTQLIGRGILNQLNGEPPPLLGSDTYRQADAVALGIGAVLLVISFVALILVLSTISTIVKGERRARLRGMRTSLLLLLHLIWIGAVAAAVYNMPELIFYNLTWRFIQVWLPSTVWSAVWFLAAALTLCAIYSLLLTFFPKAKKGTVTKEDRLPKTETVKL